MSNARQPEVAVFHFWTMVLPKIFNQIVSIRVKKLSNTIFISSRHIKGEKASLLVDVRRSKTPLLKLFITCRARAEGGTGGVMAHPLFEKQLRNTHFKYKESLME